MTFNPKNYQFSTGEHRNKFVIFVKFPYSHELKVEIKQQFPSVRYSATHTCWYIPDIPSARKIIGLKPKTGPGKTIINQIAPINREALQRLHEVLLLKAYSPNTIKTYCNEFAQLLYSLGNTPVNSLTPERLRAYFLYCVKKLKLSENIIHSRINAVKFYFEQVLHHEKLPFAEIPRPKKRSILPKVLSKKDISKIFQQVENLKHIVMLKLCYGMGLRVSEIVNLKISDIDSNRMMVHIEAAKGKKDRYVTLPTSILEELRIYYSEYRPKNYLFEGHYGGKYSVRSAQAVFKAAMRKAKINKTVGIHGLRHSYATHLLECGTDMIFIQKLLGHRDIKTTEIYAKVSNKQLSKVKSPLDDL
jgi:site-specific recombinase XerD